MSTEAEILEQILVWTRVGFYASVKQTLTDVLNSEKKRQVYQLTDGERTGESIRVAVKVSPNDLSQLYKQCTSMGLMARAGGNRRRRLFDLADFGLAPQELPSMEGASNE